MEENVSEESDLQALTLHIILKSQHALFSIFIDESSIHSRLLFARNESSIHSRLLFARKETICVKGAIC